MGDYVEEDEPNPNDVLLGAGLIIRQYPGTQQYLRWIRASKKEYDETPKGHKMDIVHRIVTLVHCSSGRFLQEVDDAWAEVPMEKVLDRTSQVFRSMKLHDNDRSKPQRILVSAKRPMLSPFTGPFGQFRNRRQSSSTTGSSAGGALGDFFDDGMISDEEAQPQPQDVLCGRGREIMMHPGTKKFFHAIQKRAKDYKDVDEKGGKLEIVHEIMKEVFERNGRFIRRDIEHRWLKVHFDKAEHKTGQIFRQMVAKKLFGTPGRNKKHKTSVYCPPLEKVSPQKAEIMPRPSDVLCGRSMDARSHPGTKWYIRTLQQRHREYETVSEKGAKSEVIESVIESVVKRNGRFIRLEGDRWVELSKYNVVAKTAQAFRDIIQKREYSPPTSNSADWDDDESTLHSQSNTVDDVPESLHALNSGDSLVPRPDDVLCGQTKQVRLHPGTNRYLRWIDDNIEEYESSSKKIGDKLEVAKRVVQDVYDRNGRFLRKVGESWVLITHKQAVVKTAQTFRYKISNRVDAPPTPPSTKGRKSNSTNSSTPRSTDSGDFATFQTQFTSTPVPRCKSSLSRNSSDKGTKRKRKSAPREPSPVILGDDSEPNPNDVLCGHGREVQEHPGSRKFAKWIQDRKREYETTTIKCGKMEIATSIVDAVYEQNGRFLRRVGNEWHEISREKAFTKTSQAFRDTIGNDSGNPSKSRSSAKSSSKSLDYKALKRHAPAGRYSSLIQEAQKSKADPEDDGDIFNGEEDDDSRGDAIEDTKKPPEEDEGDELDGASGESKEHSDIGWDDISDTETEDSYSHKHQKR
eukprot:Nitzschia sp. Nitz4//scaffold158_size52425//4024//6426//NITZ4_006851-RA/size52425-processed-gene-0.45-mRNA-1//-1//CDS//3329537489//6775//frame0